MTPVPVTLSELGINDPNIAKAFSGAENTITREADGSYIVSAISYNGETQVSNTYNIDIKIFSTNQDIKNAYAPATVQTTDGKTLIWDAEHGNWRVPYSMEDNSSFQNVDKIAEVPLGDEKIAIESLLLKYKEIGSSPFSEAALARYQKNGGDSILFAYDQSLGKSAVLKAKGNDGDVTADTATLKFSPFWIKQNIGGVMQFEPLIVNLDPADPKNPQADEFKIIIGVDLNNQPLDKFDETEKQQDISVFYGKKSFDYPVLVLYGDAQFQQTYPILAQLLALPDQTLDKMGYLDYYIRATLGLPLNLGEQPAPSVLGPNHKLIEVPLGNIPSQIQTMRIFFRIAGQ